MQETRSNWCTTGDDSNVGIPGLLVLHTSQRDLWGMGLSLSGKEPLTLGRGLSLRADTVLDDARMSRQHARVTMVSPGRAEVRDLGSRNGTYVNGAQVSQAVIGSRDVLRFGSTFCQLVPDLAVLSERAMQDVVSGEIKGMSPETCALRQRVRALAQHETDVLILGPPGAGKERCAAAIHQASRVRGRLVAINCAGITRELASSELFGHVRGAFTGANAHRDGAFKRADRGTLFLDEVADLPPDLQASILRALQERKVRPVGSDTELRFGARIVSATNRDITKMVLEDSFRGDLYSRLAGSVLRIPALSERPADVAILAETFLGAERQLHPSAMERLLLHPWVHNVRDLAAVIGLLASEEGSLVRLNQMALDKMQEDRVLAAESSDAPSSGGGDVSEVEPAHPWPADDEARVALLEELLRVHSGNVSQVARALGKRGTSVRRWIAQYGIDVTPYRPSR